MDISVTWWRGAREPTVVMFPKAAARPSPWCHWDSAWGLRQSRGRGTGLGKTQRAKMSSHLLFVLQLLSCLWLFATPWTAARQAFLSFTSSWSLLKLVSIKSVMPCNRLILCRPLLLPSIFPSIRVFSSESALCIRRPKYWSSPYL